MIDPIRQMATHHMESAFALDHRVREVLRTMALLPLAESAGAAYCLLCSASPYSPRNDPLEALFHTDTVYNEMWHDADCPVTLARQLLADIGIPLNIYRVAGEFIDLRCAPHAQQWHSYVDYRLATDPKWLEESDNKFINYRNVQIEFVRQFPLAEEK